MWGNWKGASRGYQDQVRAWGMWSVKSDEEIWAGSVCWRGDKAANLGATYNYLKGAAETMEPNSIVLADTKVPHLHAVVWDIHIFPLSGSGGLQWVTTEVRRLSILGRSQGLARQSRSWSDLIALNKRPVEVPPANTPMILWMFTVWAQFLGSEKHNGNTAQDS